jgi:hypothetical protein
MSNQQAYNRLSFRRLARDQFFGNPGQHAQDVAEIVSGAKISFSSRGVNGYADTTHKLASTLMIGSVFE